MNDPHYIRAQSGSCGGYCSARGLAKLGQVMAHRGSFNGMKLMSEKTWDIMHSDPILLEEPDFENRTFYTTGGLGYGSMKGLENSKNMIEHYCYQDRVGWFGWFGWWAWGLVVMTTRFG